MKRILWIVFILISTIGFIYFISIQTKISNKKQKVTIDKLFKQIENGPLAVYYLHIPYSFDTPVSYPNDNVKAINNPFDTIDYSFNIILQKNKKINRIQFRTCAETTSISINDSTYLTKVKNKIKTEPLINDTFFGREAAVLDISNLKKGKYYVHYKSINLHGIFPITIR